VPERSTGKALRSEQRRFRLRKPFALKLVGVLVILTVGACLWQGMRDYTALSRRLDDLTNRNGVRFVRQLALFIPTFWIKTDEKGDLVEVDQAGLDAGRRMVEARLREHARTEAGREILDIVILSTRKKNTFYASLSGKASFSWKELRVLDVPYAKDSGVTVVEGEQSGRPVRSFSAPIVRNARTVGRVVVYLSAEELKAARERLWRGVLGNMLLGALLAIIASLLLGQLLARPIKQLAADMRAVSTGDLDRRSSVSTADEVGDLARTFNHMVASLKEMQERKAAQRAMEKELGIARRIQKGLLPEKLPRLHTWAIAARWVPAKVVGGDYYDVIELGDGAWGLAVADVSGKGVPAALIMSMTRCLLRLATRAGGGPSGTLALVDEVLTPDLKGGMFVSMVYLRFEEGSGDVRVVRAGHNPPLLLRGREGRVEACQVQGVALGLRAGFGRQSLPERVLHLEPGDTLVLYSDGIVEAMNEERREYGVDRLAKIVSASRSLQVEQLADRVMADVAAHRGKAPQSDDITLVVLRRQTR